VLFCAILYLTGAVMPSSQLSSLCEQIEAQNTDHFGKFYMYVSLLNTVAVRNKSFAAGLPKYSTGLAFWRTNHLDLGGEISIEFSQQVDLYAQQFINAQPTWSTALYNLALSYMRKGNISDLAYIIDQMLNHLKAIHGPQSKNQNIYDYVDFDSKKAGIIEFIEQISAFNRQLLTVVNTVCNTGLSVAAALMGIVLMIASVFFIGSSLVGLGLLIGGAYSTYSFASQLEEQVEQLKEQVEEIAGKAQNLPINNNLLTDKNHHAFFSSIVMPLPYAALTAIEQLSFNETSQQQLAVVRDDLEKMTAALPSL
jgi:hypothetical protein